MPQAEAVFHNGGALRQQGADLGGWPQGSAQLTQRQGWPWQNSEGGKTQKGTKLVLDEPSFSEDGEFQINL